MSWISPRHPRWVVSAVPAGIVVSLALSGCSAAGTASQDEYTIGLIVSQTGAGSQLGVGELQGAKLAVDQINASGGINGKRVKLVTADDQSSPSQAVLAARKMLGSVDAIVGSSLSGACKAIAPLATSAKIVDYCLSPGIKPAGWQWSASVATVDLAKVLIDYWHSRGVDRIGLLASTDASGMDGAKSVREAVAATPGVKIVASTTFTPDAVSAISQLQQIASAKPQAVVVWSTGAGAGVAFQGMRQVGLTVPVATTDGNLTYAFVKRIANFLPDPLLIPATRDFWAPSAYPNKQVAAVENAYHSGYQKRYGTQPDFGPGVAYDGVMLVAKAIGKANGDPSKVRAALESTRNMPGVVGSYSFSADDHRGLSSRDVGIVQATVDGFKYVGGAE